MDFLSPGLQEYAEAHTTSESEVLQFINRETHSKVLSPRMLSGHLQGRLLSAFSHMLRPERILEIGTYTGYSAVCMAEGLAPNGKLYTIDVNEELEERVRSHFEKAGITDRVEFLIGDAREIIPTLKETWDLVFIDADKLAYPQYFDLVIDNMREGGFIIVDNVLWSGKIVEDVHDKKTESMRAFNKKIMDDPRVENILLPVRDGLMVIRKI
ncbi:MAG: O-methyltransferase [Cyclobacteriaceae bacterium]